MAQESTVVAIPNGGTILVRPSPPEQKSDIIVAPDKYTSNERATSGTIIGVGHLVDVAHYRPGRLVVLKEHAGREIKINGDPFLLVNESEIQGFLEDERTDPSV